MEVNFLKVMESPNHQLVQLKMQDEQLKPGSTTQRSYTQGAQNDNKFLSENSQTASDQNFGSNFAGLFAVKIFKRLRTSTGLRPKRLQEPLRGSGRNARYSTYTQGDDPALGVSSLSDLIKENIKEIIADSEQYVSKLMNRQA